EVDESVPVQPIQTGELGSLERLFAGAFRYIQPDSSLDDDTLFEAARQALERTRAGGDGPWIMHASFVAKLEEKLIGAILITLLPHGDPSDWDSYYWKDVPPPD